VCTGDVKIDGGENAVKFSQTFHLMPDDSGTNFWLCRGSERPSRASGLLLGVLLPGMQVLLGLAIGPCDQANWRDHELHLLAIRQRTRLSPINHLPTRSPGVRWKHDHGLHSDVVPQAI
jgi:hypothetical protein